MKEILWNKHWEARTSGSGRTKSDNCGVTKKEQVLLCVSWSRNNAAHDATRWFVPLGELVYGQ